jgi:hypothetical protein
MGYITITSFTTDSNKEALIKDVQRTTAEEVPMIRFVAVEVNPKLAAWIDQTLA